MFTATFQVCVGVCALYNEVSHVTCSEITFLHCAAHEGCGYEALNVEEIHNMVTELLLSAFDM